MERGPFDEIHHLAVYQDLKRMTEEHAWKNIVMTSNAIRLAEKYGSIIYYYGTTMQYDSNPCEPRKETDPPVVRNLYTLSKLAGEEMLSMYGGEYHIMRLGSVVGPFMTHGLLFNAMRSAREGRKLHIYGDGTQRRPYLYVSTIFETIERLRDSDVKLVTVAPPDNLSALDVVKIVEEYMGGIDMVFDPPLKGDAYCVMVDNSVLRSIGVFPPPSELAVRMAIEEILGGVDEAR